MNILALFRGHVRQRRGDRAAGRKHHQLAAALPGEIRLAPKFQARFADQIPFAITLGSVLFQLLGVDLSHIADDVPTGQPARVRSKVFGRVGVNPRLSQPFDVGFDLIAIERANGRAPIAGKFAVHRLDHARLLIEDFRERGQHGAFVFHFRGHDLDDDLRLRLSERTTFAIKNIRARRGERIELDRAAAAQLRKNQSGIPEHAPLAALAAQQHHLVLLKRARGVRLKDDVEFGFGFVPFLVR